MSYVTSVSIPFISVFLTVVQAMTSGSCACAAEQVQHHRVVAFFLLLVFVHYVMTVVRDSDFIYFGRVFFIIY